MGGGAAAGAESGPLAAAVAALVGGGLGAAPLARDDGEAVAEGSWGGLVTDGARVMGGGL